MAGTSSPNATLLVAVQGGADARRTFGEIGGEHRRANAAMSADARRAAGDRRRIEAEEVAQARRDYRSLVEASKNSQRERTRAALLESGNRRRADQQAATERARAEQQATRLAISEGKRRERGAAAEARYIEQIAREITRAKERELREQARNQRRADAEEVREAQRVSRQMGQARARDRRTSERSANDRYAALGTVAGAARGAVVGLHGEVQDARQRRAGTERDLGNALYQAGGTRASVQSAMRRVQAFAVQSGIDPAELAAAANAAQGQFSVFGDARTSEGDRSARVGQFLASAQLARDTGNDVTQFTRLDAMLGAQHISAEDRRAMLLYAGGAAQHGSVELGDLTAAAMPSLMARMSQAQVRLGPGATNAQRGAASQAAFAQTISELEVAAGMGGTPRAAGNALAAVNRSLQNTTTQDRLRHNILSAAGMPQAERTRMEAELFENDPTRRGHRRLRAEMTDALSLSQRFGELSGNDSTRFANVFGGGGRGNPQSLQANWRNIMASMMNTDAEGTPAWRRVRNLMNVQETSLNQADVSRGHELFGQDTQSELVRNQAEHDRSLLDNTGALANLSNRINDWIARNPIGSRLLGTGGGLLMGAFGGGGGGGGGAGGSPVAQVQSNLGNLGGALTRATAATAAFAVGLGVGGALNSGISRLIGRREDSLDRQDLGTSTLELMGGIHDVVAGQETVQAEGTQGYLDRILGNTNAMNAEVAAARGRGASNTDIAEIVQRHDLDFTSSGAVYNRQTGEDVTNVAGHTNRNRPGADGVTRPQGAAADPNTAAAVHAVGTAVENAIVRGMERARIAVPPAAAAHAASATANSRPHPNIGGG